MIVMTDIITTRREDARDDAGRFGVQQHSAPDLTLTGHQSHASTRGVRGNLAVPFTESRGFLRGTHAAVQDVNVVVNIHWADEEHTLPGDNGERIFAGQAVLPTGISAAATDDKVIEYITSLASVPTGQMRRHDAAALAEREVQQLARRFVIIGDQLWGPASLIR